MDTACIPSPYPAFGLQNVERVNTAWPNRVPEKPEETGYYYMIEGEYATKNKANGLFSLDTIPLSEFEKLKRKYTSPLNTDSSLISRTDSTLIVNGRSFKADRRDYGEFNYYIGYLVPLQLYGISYIDGRNEVGDLVMLDKVSNKAFYLVSPSDYPLDSPSVSTDLSFLSAYVNDLYDDACFISLFSILKEKNSYCLEDYAGLKLTDSRIDDLVWIGPSAFVMLVSDIRDYKNVKQLALKVKVGRK